MTRDATSHQEPRARGVVPPTGGLKGREKPILGLTQASQPEPTTREDQP